VLTEIGGLDSALALMVQNGNAEMAADQFATMTAEAKRNGVSVTELKELFPGYQSALQGIANDQKEATLTAETQAQKTDILRANLDATYGSLTGYAAALGLDDQATKDLIARTSELGQSLGDFINPLGAYTTMLQEKATREEDAARATAEKAGASAESWRDFVKDTGFSFDEYMRRLEEQVTAQTNWQTNMLTLAGRVSQGTLEELARMGPEGAPLVADLVNRSDTELDRFDDITALRSKEATDAWGAQLTMAGPVLAAVSAKAGQGVVAELARQLQAGTITVAQIAAQYGVGLANGINPVLQGLGKPRITVSGWDAAGFMGPVQLANKWVGGYTGDGGKYEPKGVVHGGEYVLTKEQTSSLGIDRIEAFANGYADGGFVSAASVPKPRSTAPYQPPISTAADATMQREYDEVSAYLTAQEAVSVGPAAGAGVQRWLPVVLQSLGMVGQPASLAQTVLRRMNQESGGNPTIVNRSDINWTRGTPSVGLMQVIGPTYRAYKDSRHDVGPYSYGTSVDPLANILASEHYAMSRYGSLSAAYNKAGGYDNGGPLMPGYTLAYNGTGKPENVQTAAQAAAQYGLPVGSSSSRGAISVTAPAPVLHIYIDGQELRGMARVEAQAAAGGLTTAINRALSSAGVR
jgi:hypothetical protein